MTMHEQLEVMASTDILAGPHGAGLTLLLYLPPGAAVLEFTEHLTPLHGQRSVGNTFLKLAEWAGHPHATALYAEEPDPADIRRKIEVLIRNGRNKAEAI